MIREGNILSNAKSISILLGYFQLNRTSQAWQASWDVSCVSLALKLTRFFLFWHYWMRGSWGS